MYWEMEYKKLRIDYLVLEAATGSSDYRTGLVSAYIEVSTYLLLNDNIELSIKLAKKQLETKKAIRKKMAKSHILPKENEYQWTKGNIFGLEQAIMVLSEKEEK